MDEVLPDAASGPMVAGLTLYASCFSKASFAGVEASGRTWKSIRSTALSQQSCADGSTRNMDLQFKNTPSFSRRDGFAMGQNTLTGPLSYLMGINGDMAFSVMTLMQFTSDLPSDATEATLFKFYANTLNNNGAALVMRRGTPVSNMISCECFLKIGNGIQLQCTMNGSGNVLLQPRRPYMLAVVKDYGRIQVCLVDMGAADFSRTTLLDTNVGSHEPLTFSNTDMTINDKANLNANIMTFSVFARALTDGDITDWHKHYSGILKQFDAAYVQITQSLQQAQQATSCTFDTVTCSTCSGVRDWSNMSDILASGGQPCLTAIDAYCSANPTQPRCECWNLNNPAYATSCASMRAMFSGQPLVAPPAPGAPAEPAEAAPPPPSCAAPPAPAVLDSAQLIKSIVTPDNIVAIGKAISEIQGAKSHHHKKHCCCSQCKPQNRDVCSKPAPIVALTDEELLAEGTGGGAASAATKSLLDHPSEQQPVAAESSKKGFLGWLFGL